ncbi:SLAC1, putative isoform 2 [Hibiscus syriacus]|uniref:SLAC1, putative isoform 2 n=1 Tax=Hibiscus syriacus TaxID=106335 RepID=A0A6A2WRH3_HIBSY|nr:SLAC1, putative isoform 2 [Hibiscus syriacus]
MWKTLATATSTKFLHISLTVNLILWWISIALVAAVSSIYLTKVVLYFEAVCREYYHPIGVNFFFAPWIALLFLALEVPPSVATTLPVALWYVLMTPFFFLELKIYGQWMSGGQRRLSKVANPTNHLSVFGNFVGALLGASMGRPFSPSVASMAWANIQGSFDYGSRIAYSIALFSLAYTFPMTGSAIATMRYSMHVFVLRDLFPIDIAISDRKPKPQNKWFNLTRHGSSDHDIETSLKFTNSESKDIEAALKIPTAEAN